MSRLVVGATKELLVRHERVDLGAAGTGLRLLYASDLHLGRPWTERVGDQVLGAVDATDPHAALLGGDLVDGRRGLGPLAEFVQRLSARVPVAAVPGNHDRAAGLDAVRAVVVDAGGRWLPDGPLDVGGVRVEGPEARADGAAVRVLCGHDPTVWERARDAGYAAVLAGHLHGCQWVAFERRGRLYPGAWVYRWNGLRFESRTSTMLVSRGAGDTLPLRWNCPREVLLISSST